MGIVVFNVSTFRARYPEFTAVLDATLQAYFNEAAMLYLDNTDCSLVADVNVRALLLNMLVAHLAALFSGINGDPASPLVGRVSQAVEGTVTVNVAMSAQPGSPEWYQQTKYGAQYWQSTLPYRNVRYIPRPSCRR